MSDKIKQIPIGIAPRWFVTEERLKKLSEAIDRYKEANIEPNAEWFEEFYELYAWLVKFRSKKEEKS